MNRSVICTRGIFMKENEHSLEPTANTTIVPDAEQYARENPGHVDDEFLDTYTKGLMDLNEQLSDNFQDSASAGLKVVL